MFQRIVYVRRYTKINYYSSKLPDKRWLKIDIVGEGVGPGEQTSIVHGPTQDERVRDLRDIGREDFGGLG